MCIGSRNKAHKRAIALQSEERGSIARAWSAIPSTGDGFRWDASCGIERQDPPGAKLLLASPAASEDGPCCWHAHPKANLTAAEATVSGKAPRAGGPGSPRADPSQSSSLPVAAAFFMEARTILAMRSSGVAVAATAASLSAESFW